MNWYKISQLNDYLYHGTSLLQYEKIKANNFIVKNLYVGDNKENITDHYAERQSKIDGSYPVTIIFDKNKLKKILEKDYHIALDGEEEQMGQFYFSGNCKKAIIKAEMYNYDEDKIINLWKTNELV